MLERAAEPKRRYPALQTSGATRPGQNFFQSGTESPHTLDELFRFPQALGSTLSRMVFPCSVLRRVFTHFVHAELESLRLLRKHQHLPSDDTRLDRALAVRAFVGVTMERIHALLGLNLPLSDHIFAMLGSQENMQLC